MHRAPPLVVSVASLACPPPRLVSVVCALLVVSVACAQRPPQSRRSRAPPSSRSHAPSRLGQLDFRMFLARSYTPFGPFQTPSRFNVAYPVSSSHIVLTLVCPSA